MTLCLYTLQLAKNIADEWNDSTNKKPHIFTMQGRKWGKTEVPHVDAKIGV
jgi:hypothetical protein